MIPSREEIEKAVKIKRNVIPGSIRETICANSILVSLAEAYLAIEGIVANNMKAFEKLHNDPDATPDEYRKQEAEYIFQAIQSHLLKKDVV